MSTVPAPRRSRTTTAALIGLGIPVAVLALGSGLLTVGTSLTTAIASAELAAGAMMPSGNAWMLPALFTVMVFGGTVVAVYLIGGRGRPLIAEVREPVRDHRPAAMPFELRAPDRAVAEADRGLFRSIDS